MMQKKKPTAGAFGGQDVPGHRIKHPMRERKTSTNKQVLKEFKKELKKMPASDASNKSKLPSYFSM